MAPEKASLIRFTARWSRATDATVPPVDIEKGTERLLRAAIKKPVRDRRLPLWIAAAALVVLAAVFLSLRLLQPHQFTVDNRPAAAGMHLAESTTDQVLRFSEGSTVTLTAGSSLAVREVDERGAHLAIEHGSVKVDVVTRPGARWAIDAGPFVVRVVGTAFKVEWQPESQHFVLSVVRGTVSVTGPMLGEGRLISGGKQCTVDWRDERILIDNIDHAQETPRADDTPSAGETEPLRDEAALQPLLDPNAATSAQSPAMSAKRSRSGSSPSTDRNREKRSVTWQSLERAGQFQRAVEEAERIGLDTIYDLAGSEDLMSLARAARFVGREDISKGALLSCRRRFAGSRDSGMAAYLLGRNATPTEAVKWFSTYLAEQPDGVWAREASGRLIEANRASGNARAAREAAKQYLDRYPAGPHAEFAKKVLEN
jgi:hypothetical protein